MRNVRLLITDVRSVLLLLQGILQEILLAISLILSVQVAGCDT